MNSAPGGVGRRWAMLFWYYSKIHYFAIRCSILRAGEQDNRIVFVPKVNNLVWNGDWQIREKNCCCKCKFGHALAPAHGLITSGLLEKVFS